MILRCLTLVLFFVSFSFAAYQEVRIGKIDEQYNNQISKTELRTILKEIETTFESQLGMDIFNYSNSGKPIDIIYLPPSKLEKKVLFQVEKIKKKKKEIERYQDEYFPKKKKEIDTLKKEFGQKNKSLDKKIAKFNKYIKSVNAKKRISIDEFEDANEYAKSQKYKLNKEIKKLKSEQKYIGKKVNEYNRRVSSYNNSIRQFNGLNRELEVMNRNFKKIRGRTYGIKEIKLKTEYRDGKKIKTKDVSTSMNKIEIYGFNSRNELKAILAHEIAHLVGIPHISKKGALMNPILQKNQIDNLYLTRDDIKAFRKYF